MFFEGAKGQGREGRWRCRECSEQRMPFAGCCILCHWDLRHRRKARQRNNGATTANNGATTANNGATTANNGAATANNGPTTANDGEQRHLRPDNIGCGLSQVKITEKSQMITDAEKN